MISVISLNLYGQDKLVTGNFHVEADIAYSYRYYNSVYYWEKELADAFDKPGVGYGLAFRYSFPRNSGFSVDPVIRFRYIGYFEDARRSQYFNLVDSYYKKLNLLTVDAGLNMNFLLLHRPVYKLQLSGGINVAIKLKAFERKYNELGKVTSYDHKEIYFHRRSPIYFTFTLNNSFKIKEHHVGLYFQNRLQVPSYNPIQDQRIYYELAIGCSKSFGK
ncbi:MAG: hypothetical protein ACI9J3_002417 [Parvicellaceae bacterium]